MKVTDLPALQTQLRSGGRAPAYLLVAKEKFTVEEGERAVAQLCEDFERVTMRAEEVSTQRLLGELASSNLFGSGTLVHVRDGDKLKKTVSDALVDYLSHPNVNNTLIVTASSCASHTRLFKAFDQAGVVLAVPAQKPWEKEKGATTWAQSAAKKLGKGLDASAAQQLVAAVGTDQLLLIQELRKLACYVGDRKAISTADIAALACKTAPAVSWELADMVLRRDAASAVAMTQQLLGEGTALLALVAMFRKQMQTCLQVWDVIASGGGPAQVTEQLPQLRGKAAQNKLNLAQQYGGERLKRALVLLADTELAAKSSQTSDTTLALQLIGQLVQ